MKLSIDSLSEINKIEAGIGIPNYDIEEIRKNTLNNPKWIHFGAGNIFRGFIAGVQDELLNRKKSDTGIIAVESFDHEIIDAVYSRYDNLVLNVIMDTKGDFKIKVTGSIVKGMTTKSSNGDLELLKKYSENPKLQILSFTITEKGYEIKSHDGNYFSVIESDISDGPENPVHIISVITSLLYNRFNKNAKPITLLSLDNCSNNGDKIKKSIMEMSNEWLKRGYVTKLFIEYLSNSSMVSFPLSMIDKITPRPASSVRSMLLDKGFEDMNIIVTSKNTHIAPYVNAENSEYLVIEDNFANGRPELESAGIMFTDRTNVIRTETMKVATCLNPLHTALAITGCLLGYTAISDTIKDPILNKLIKRIGYEEGLPVVVYQNIIDPKAFIDEVINERLPNPYIPDTPQRIASDTSQKVKIRFGITINKYHTNINLDIKSLVGIQLVIAAWCRYLMGIDDYGNPFDLSPDPMSDHLHAIMEKKSLGDKESNISRILSDADIFGTDLYDVGIGKNIENIFIEMIAGKGAVSTTLKKYLY